MSIRDKIHFAHANGFPARSYAKLFSLLEADYEIGFLERHAHDPRFPVSDGWRFLAEELRVEIERRYREPVIGIGHSLGGILHFLVAVERPDLYKSLILLDAPIISRLSGAGIKILKRANLMERFSPARATRFRRAVWSGKNEAFEHFRRKEKFRVFNEDVLRDYVEHGTIEHESGVRLVFEPKIETLIYKTIPDDFGKYVGRLKVPTAYIGGTRSTEARLARIGFMKRKFDFRFRFIEGSHLFPFEKPFETAALIKETISSLKI